MMRPVDLPDRQHLFSRAETDALIRALRHGEVDAVVSDSSVWLLRAQQAEATLRVLEEQYRAVVESLHDAVYMVDRTGRITFGNTALARLTGHGVEEVLGRPAADLYGQDMAPTLLERCQRVLHGEGLASPLEAEMRRKDNTRIPVEVSMGPIMRQGEILGYVAAVRDITERRRADDALRHVRDNLERRVQERTAELMQANEILRQEIAVRRHAEEQLHQQREALYHREKLAAMGSLLASVAHELNNPLSVVMMQADLLREDIREGLLAEQAKIIAQSAERCVRIVRNFLTLARPHPPERQPVALNTVVREAVELLAYGLRVDNIEVTLDLASKLPAVGGDAHQLHQVVANLITNAHQALREVPSPRRLTLTTHDDPTHHRVVLVVADTGPGIPLQLQERIFEPFFTTKPPGIGTGLGLPLCRGIIEGHGGTIQVQSQPGQGTMFQIALPSEVFPATAATPPSLEALPVRQQTPTILVVDDEPGIATGLAYLLRRSGYTVDIAANGRLALGQLQERDYDLILCDLRMPELDGPGFYRRLGESYPHLLQRVIFLTGDTLSPEAQEFLDKLEVSRLNKPFRAAEVRRVVEQVLHTL